MFCNKLVAQINVKNKYLIFTVTPFHKIKKTLTNPEYEKTEHFNKVINIFLKLK